MACWKKSGEITDVLLPDPEEPPAAPCCWDRKQQADSQVKSEQQVDSQENR